MVGRDHRHQLGAIVPRPLGGDHLAVVGIDAIVRDAPGLPGLSVLGVIPAESPSDQADAAIQLGGHAMHRPDERARTAAHHGDPYGPALYHATRLAR